MKTFGDNLKEIRENNNLSQADFAEKMQTTQQRVSEWERNKVEPSLYNIVRILKIFNIKFEELIDDVNLDN